jgi:hypothetical protein
MPTLKQDRSLMKRHFRDMLLLGVPFGLIIIGMVCGLRWFDSMPVFIGGFVLGVPLAIVGLVRQERRFRRFRCPTCGTMLQRSGPGERGAPIRFTCTACDTEWDTGFCEGSD